MKVARTCAPASARLSLQAMRLSYFKKRFYLLIAEKYNVASQWPIEAILLRKSSRAVCALRDL